VARGIRLVIAAGVVLAVGFLAFIVAFLLLWDAFEPGTGDTGAGGQVAAVIVLAVGFLICWGLFNLIGGVRRAWGALGTLATWAGGVVLLIVTTVLRG
jgi:hypothetical protein